MNKILLIIQREYVTRVAKKSFIIMTILAPILIGLMYAAIGWAALSSIEQKKIEVIDDSNLFKGKFKTNDQFKFDFVSGEFNSIKSNFDKSGYDVLVHIPANILENTEKVKMFSLDAISLDLQNSVVGTIEKEIETIKLTEAGITKSILESAKMNIRSESISLKNGAEKKNSAGASTAIGALCGILIYMAVFIYGAQVMRSITEEKTSRIVEILISSVKPFQLMIGKIIGVGLVGLTQFALWILLSFGVITVLTETVGGKMMNSQSSISESQLSNLPPEAQELANQNTKNGSMGIISEVQESLETLPITTIVVSFLFYFFGGYLLYSALFGAVGSAVDSDTDAQQFMLPITIPIIASFALAQFVIRDPNSSLAFWLSMVPFTSPIIMMVRIPFGVPVWQIVLSVFLLIGGFVFTTWIAARIYRVGILMYGKKVTWKELGKWIFYKS
jgi:ABC-2 type transport system permease protein